MRVLAASSVLLLASSIPFANGQKYGEDWDYVGEANAANQEGNWGKAAEECDGQMQSPIDITTSAVRPAGLSKPKFSYGKLDENDISGVERSKKSIQFNLNGEAKMSMTLFGRAYELLQFHFHWPSEHTIDGENAESELHLVHQHEDGELAVVSVLIDSKDGLERDSALEQLKDVAVEEDLEDLNLPLKKLLPRPMEFYYYTGSLTTPPCSEGVVWVVMSNKFRAGKSTIDEFKQVMGKHQNNRSVQELNNRIILGSASDGGAPAPAPAPSPGRGRGQGQ